MEICMRRGVCVTPPTHTACLLPTIPLVFYISITSWCPPLCISRQKVMDILSLSAWPLVILFHRPEPYWREHNGGRSTSSQSIFWQTWSSKLVCFGKGMTKDLFTTPLNQYKDQWMLVVFSLPPLYLRSHDFHPVFTPLCIRHRWVQMKC